VSNLATAELPVLVSWEEFQLLPERPENGKRYELHDGEVVVVPPARPLHLFVQMILPELLRFVQEWDLVAVQEYPYRPALNYQFWAADVAVLPRGVRNAMRDWTDYDVYSPPLIIEVLSPSDRKTKGTNTPEKIARQRVASMSNGTREFWVIDADKRTVHVTNADGVKLYSAGDLVPVTLTPGKSIAVDAIFAAE
jgi:Uma2 family endonuclease